MPLTRASRILVIDESPEALALFRDTLAVAGYRNVATASSLADGLKVLEAERPDVVFTDLPLTDPLAVEFPRRALRESPALRLILTTELPPTHEAVLLAISHGAADVLPKPGARDAAPSLLDALARGPRGGGIGDWAYG